MTRAVEFGRYFGDLWPYDLDIWPFDLEHL